MILQAKIPCIEMTRVLKAEPKSTPKMSKKSSAAFAVCRRSRGAASEGVVRITLPLLGLKWENGLDYPLMSVPCHYFGRTKCPFVMA